MDEGDVASSVDMEDIPLQVLEQVLEMASIEHHAPSLANNSSIFGALNGLIM